MNNEYLLVIGNRHILARAANLTTRAGQSTLRSNNDETLRFFPTRCDPNPLSSLCLIVDYVYFETSSTSPFQIRRIEELNKTASGNVEAKVMCFYRRRDLPSQLIQLADKHQCKSGPRDSFGVALLCIPGGGEGATFLAFHAF